MLKGRFLSVLIICCLLISAIVTGCGPKETVGKQAVTLEVWHWMTDRQTAFFELAKKYEEETGVKVNFQLYAPSDAYSQKVRAAGQGMNLPDVFGILGEKRDFASFIKAGHILDLTSYMESSGWGKKFFAKALAVNEFKPDNIYGVNPGIYAVPIDIMTIQLVYNKDLLAQLGFDPQSPPKSFKELLEVGKKAKLANLQGFVSGWGEMWMLDCFANNYAFNIMGQDKVLATIRGDVPYTDPDWIKVFSIFKDMQESGLLAKGIVTMVNKVSEQMFANGKAVFAFNGSWCVNVYKGMNPNLNYAAVLPPKLSEAYPMVIWGGAGSSFMVNARARNKEEAVKFLQWLTDKQQQEYLAQNTNNLPANKDSLSSIPDILAQFARSMETTTHPNIWGVSEYPAVIETLDKGLQSIIIGEKTPQDVASETQKIKERELAKKKK